MIGVTYHLNPYIELTRFWSMEYRRYRAEPVL